MGLVSRVRLRTVDWRPNDRLDADFRCLTTVVRVPEAVLNLDPYLSPGEGNAGEAAVIEGASEALARHREFQVMLRGLTVSPWTVFARAYGADGPIAAMRATLRRALHERSDARRRDSRLRRALPLVLSNAARFTAPVDPALLRAVYARRDHVFGPLDVREIEIVRSDGIMSPKQTDVLSRADLRP